MTDIFRAAGRVTLGAAFALCMHHALATDGAAVVIDSDNNLVLLGGQVNVPHPIPHNFVAAGGLVVIDKPVGHNAALAGGSVRVTAPIGKNLAVGGGTVTVDAPVGGNLAAGAGEIHIGKGATVGSDARLTASHMDMDGTVHGDLYAVGEALTINGTVDGDVDAEVERIVLGPAARIRGSVKYVADKDIEKAEGATIGGEVVRRATGTVPHGEQARTAATVVGWIATVIGFLFVLGAGAIFLASAPIFSVEAPDRVRASPGKSLGVGLLTVLFAPLAAVLLMLTIVGIPVGIVILAMYPLALLLGFVVGVLWLAGWGSQLVKQPPPATVAKAVGYFALALAVITLVSKVPVLGGVLAGLLLLMGVGAFEVELLRRMRSGSGAMRGRVEVVRP